MLSDVPGGLGPPKSDGVAFSFPTIQSYSSSSHIQHHPFQHSYRHHVHFSGVHFQLQQYCQSVRDSILVARSVVLPLSLSRSLSCCCCIFIIFLLLLHHLLAAASSSSSSLFSSYDHLFVVIITMYP